MGNCQEMGQQDLQFLWLSSICQVSLSPICLCPPQPQDVSRPGWPPSNPDHDRTDSSHQFFAPGFPSGNLFTTELALTNPLPTFLPLPMKRKVTGLVSLTMLVTNLHEKFLLSIPYLQICCKECQYHHP